MILTYLRPKWWLVLLVAGLLQTRAAVVPLSVTVSNPPSGAAVRLGWTASPSTNVTGYFLNWGLASGQCTNQLDAGIVTNTWVSGMASNTIYYFNVVAYAAARDQAPPSNELAYSPTPPVLTLRSQPNGSGPATVSLSFQGTAGTTYLIQATPDLQQWTTVWTTNRVASGPIVYSASDPPVYPKRFYRVIRQ